MVIDGEYSKASDIWAFGVLIWEMFALIDKELDESEGEIIPYEQLASKEQVRFKTFNFLTWFHRLGGDLEPCGLGKIITKLVKYQAVLHVKPFNKLYVLRA